jgi:hypothetical protein
MTTPATLQRLGPGGTPYRMRLVIDGKATWVAENDDIVQGILEKIKRLALGTPPLRDREIAEKCGYGITASQVSEKRRAMGIVGISGRVPYMDAGRATQRPAVIAPADETPIVDKRTPWHLAPCVGSKEWDVTPLHKTAEGRPVLAASVAKCYNECPVRAECASLVNVGKFRPSGMIFGGIPYDESGQVLSLEEPCRSQVCNNIPTTIAARHWDGHCSERCTRVSRYLAKPLKCARPGCSKVLSLKRAFDQSIYCDPICGRIAQRLKDSLRQKEQARQAHPQAKAAPRELRPTVRGAYTSEPVRCNSQRCGKILNPNGQTISIYVRYCKGSQCRAHALTDRRRETRQALTGQTQAMESQ